MATLIDLANNAQGAPTTGDLLGFSGIAEAQEILGVDAYEFLYLPIRQADQRQGALFLKRYFQGIQEVWGAIVARARALPDIWDVTKATDETLQYLKNIVGWTQELAHVTDRLDALQLRRLIAASPAIWNTLGPEDSWLNVIALLASTRSRVWTWFDFRFILDESAPGEEHDGRDAWMISLPGPPDMDDMRSNVRVVDDGTGEIDRQLVMDVLEVMRPAGERIEVSWISFLDLFLLDGDETQWTSPDNFVVEDGVGKLGDDGFNEVAYAVAPLSASWTNLVAFARVRGSPAAPAETFGLAFYSDGDDDEYRAGIDVVGGVVTLSKIVGGVETVISSVAPPFLPLFSDVWYGLRVEVVPDPGGNRIRVFLDADLVIDAVDGAHAQGTVGLFHIAGATLECDEVEVFLLPLATDIIGPGT